jgi:hypothetical protein
MKRGFDDSSNSYNQQKKGDAEKKEALANFAADSH